MADEGKTFSNDHEFASEQGKKGGATQPDEVYKPSEHDGLRKDGQPDKRMSSEHGEPSLPLFLSYSLCKLTPPPFIRLRR